MLTLFFASGMFFSSLGFWACRWMTVSHNDPRLLKAWYEVEHAFFRVVIFMAIGLTLTLTSEL